MKHFLRNTCILLGLAGVLIAAPIAPFQNERVHAQQQPPAAQNLPEYAEQARTQPDPDFGCIGGSGSMLEGCGTAAAYYIMKGCAYVAVWASVILNIVIRELVVNMGVLVGNMPGITDAWEVVRDIVNVFLVFITVYIGISMIVGSENFGSKKMLGRVILAALLVNFSGTLTKLVIDVSNVMAISGYSMLLNEGQKGTVQSTVTAGECAQPNDDNYDMKKSVCITTGIAGVFWSKLQMTKIFNIQDFQGQGGTKDNPKETDDGLIWVGLLGAIMFLVLAFVLGAMAFMLIGRFLILVMCIIFSPLAFVALITGISGRGREWWSKLTNQAIVAPVMFLMLWISYRMIEGFTARLNLENGIAKSAMGDTGGIAILTYFVIIIGSIIMSLIVAKELGATGASAAISTGNKWSRKIAMAPVNRARDMGLATARGLRDRTVSRWANNRMERRERLYAESNEQNPDGSYRRQGPMHRIRRRLTGTAYDRGRRARQEAAAAGARNLDQARQTRQRQIGDEVSRRQDLEAARTTNRTHDESEATLRAWARANPRLTPEVRDAAGGPTRRMNEDEYVNYIEDARRRVGRMNQQTQEWMVQNHADVISHAGTATRIGASHMQSLEQSQTVTNAQTAPIQAARRTAYQDGMGFTAGRAANPAAARTVARNFTEAEWRTIGRQVIGGRLERATSHAEVDAIFNTMPESAIQYLPNNVFGNNFVQERLTAGHLTALTNANTIQDPVVRTAIGNHIVGHGTASAQQWMADSPARFVWL